jgi:toxin ParE1/3/4
MSTRLTWSAQARDDLLNIYVLIGLEQPAAAERYFDRIEAKAELLRSQPRMGVRRSDIRVSMGCWSSIRISFCIRPRPIRTKAP